MMVPRSAYRFSMIACNIDPKERPGSDTTDVALKHSKINSKEIVSRKILIPQGGKKKTKIKVWIL